MDNTAVPSPSAALDTAGEAGFPVVSPAPVDLLATDESVPRARLVELLRRAQAERDAAAEEARRLDSRLTVAAIELDALRQQAAVYGDPSEPLSVACALLHRVDLHEFADGLALVREAREWAGLAFMHNRAA